MAVRAGTGSFFRLVTIAVRVALDGKEGRPGVTAIAVLVVLLRLSLPILPPFTVIG
jgi:hypothetical protein